MDGSVLEEKSSSEMMRLTFSSKFNWVLTLQSNLCITTTSGTKFLQQLQTGGHYREDLCITAKTVNSDIWLFYKGSNTFQLITNDTDKNKSCCIFV